MFKFSLLSLISCAFIAISLFSTGIFASANTDTATIQIQNGLYTNPSQKNENTISVCEDGLWKQTNLAKGMHSYTTTVGSKEYRLYANVDTAISCRSAQIKHAEFYVETLDVKKGQKINFGLYGEPKLIDVAKKQSMDISSKVHNPDGPAIVKFEPMKDSQFGRICVDGKLADEARYREYFVEPGNRTFSFANNDQSCNHDFSRSFHIFDKATTSISLENITDFSNACTKGVEIYVDVNEEKAVAQPVKPVSTELAVQSIQNSVLPRSGGFSGGLVVGIVSFVAIGILATRKQSLKIDLI